MVEMVGGALLTVVFEKLFEQLASPELRKNSVASKLKILGEKLEKVRLYLDDAEDKQLFDKKVKEWLDHLKHVVFKAVDLVVEIIDSKKEKKSNGETVMRMIKSVYHSVAKTVQGEIDLILRDLDPLLDRALVLQLKHVGSYDAQSSRYGPAIFAPLREEHHVFGREAEREEILEMLLSEMPCRLGVLPIVGMGGLGKTTLAQLVYCDRRVKEHFPLRAWVTVSTQFDVCSIIKNLLHNVNPGTSTSDINNPNELQELMKEAVRGKKFLFVLDDVWEDSYSNWDLLKSNFVAGDSRSRVIVTTRSIVVGSNVKTGPMYELEKVGDDDCWSIFVHHAFNGDPNADAELQAIGRRIVAKCKGLPLAVISLGDFLRSKRNPKKWENILSSDVGDWSRVMETRVLPSLWLSYRYLPPSLKQCFAYCSIFPQDHKFKKKSLVQSWMNEGFLQSDEKYKSMEEVGEQYFDDLVSRSLFQRSSEDEDVFIMHDLVRDIAVFVYGREAEKEKTISSSKEEIIAPLRVEHIVFGREAEKEKTISSSREEIIAPLRVEHIVFGREAEKEKTISSSTEEIIAPLRVEHIVFGREAEREYILKWLFSEEDKIGVLPIVGRGGLGKTTLAQLVYDDKGVEKHGFTLKAWVTVSTQFDVCRIIKELLQKVNPGTSTSDINDPTELQELMNEAVRGKFLFVLDDVREENYDSWYPLMTNFIAGDSQRRVIVTTRSIPVGSIEGPVYELKEVHEDDCWSLFVHHAFNGDTNADVELQAIGRRIIAKCKGLPLAVKSVAGLLRSERDPQTWENILSRDVGDWSKVMENGVLPSLWLSYNNLPPSLKECFAYCSLFPQGYEFDKKSLVLFWMAEGYLPPDEKDKSMEEVGEQWFDYLVSRMLFQRLLLQRSDKDESKFLMHHLIHDLATFVSGEYNSIPQHEKRGIATRSNQWHASFDSHLDSVWQLSDTFLKHKQLRTLFLNGQSEWDVERGSGDLVRKIISKFKFLRMLDLHNSGIKVITSSIGELKCLRYLDLSRNVSLKELPKSISSLCDLQTLKLNNCSNLRALSGDITKLVNLRILENDSCYSLTHMPQGLGQMSNLRTVFEFVLPKSTNSKRIGKLDELKNLNFLNGSLKIKNLRCPDCDRTKDASLKDKKHLRSLALIWNIEACTYHKRSHERSHELSLDELQPPENLQELCLSSYGGVRFSSWLPSHKSLVEFMLLKCTKCQYLPALDCLTSLRVLRVDELAELTHVSEEESQEFFPSLRELELKNLPKLKQWWKQPDNVKHKAFPSLSKLVIEDCPNLTSMPRFPGLEEQLVMKNTKWDPFQQTISWSEASSSEASSSSASSLRALSKLRTLSIVDMSGGDVAIWKSLPSLRALTLDHIPKIMPILEALQCLTDLKELNILRCNSLKEISGWIDNIKSLTSLSIRLCPDFKIPSNQIHLIATLKRVKIENCPSVCHIEGMVKHRLYTS